MPPDAHRMPPMPIGCLGEQSESDEGTRVRSDQIRRRPRADQIRSDTGLDAKTQSQIRSDAGPFFFRYDQIPGATTKKKRRAWGEVPPA